MAMLKRLVLFSVVLAVLFTVLPLSAFADAPDIYENARAVARAEVWKDINSGIAGSATVAITVNGEIVYAEGFGMADREQSIPVDRNTIFNIGSISKVFTATAIMLLVDEGKVNLDDPVTVYLPEFKMADPRYKEITVRMLLNHASGLPGTTGSNNFGFAYNTDFFNQTLTSLSYAHLKHRPGAMSPYCNDGFTLAEMIVERVSGQKFIDFLSQRVFVPLSMTNSGPGVGAQPGKTAAAYYWPENGKREPLEVLSLLGAGGLSSTAVDLCRFEDSFSGSGTQIFSSSALAEMRKGQPSAFLGKLKHGEVAFGLGWDMTDLPTYRAQGIQVLGKSGGTGRYSSMMFTVPAHRISVAVIETAESGHALQIALEVLDAVLVAKGLLKEEPASVSKPLSHQPIPAQYASFDGYYVPLKRISFDFKMNIVTMKTMPIGQEPQTVTLFYNNGYFYSDAGDQYYFISVDGEDYLVQYRAALDVDMMVGQKLKTLDRPQSLRIDMNGTLWLQRSSKWFDGVQGTAGHMVRTRTFSDLPGYVEFGTIERVMSPDFAGMPVSNIRDLYELTLIDRDGTTWARVSESLFSPASAAPVFKGGSRSLTIGAEGYSEWLKLADGLILSFEQPEQTRVLVLSADGESIFDSMLDQGAVYAAKGSFIEFAGNPGAELKIEGK